MSCAGARVWALVGVWVLVIVNVRDRIVNYTLPAAVANTSWTNALTQVQTDLATSVSLAPFQYIILKKL